MVDILDQVHQITDVKERLHGWYPDRDIEIIKRLCLPNKVIGEHLGMKANAVAVRVMRIGDKLGVENRAAIIVRALQLNLVKLDQLYYREFYDKAN